MLFLNNKIILLEIFYKVYGIWFGVFFIFCDDVFFDLFLSGCDV